MGELVIPLINSNSLTLSEIEKEGLITLRAWNWKEVEVDIKKEQAIQIISHLQKEFSI